MKAEQLHFNLKNDKISNYAGHYAKIGKRKQVIKPRFKIVQTVNIHYRTQELQAE